LRKKKFASLFSKEMLEIYESDPIGSLPLIFGLLEYIDLSTHINSTYPSHKNWRCGNKGLIIRGEYKIERRIRNLKQEVCALLPIYLQKDDRIVGLVNLLTLLLQIVSIAEYQMAQSLKEEEQENPKK
jgi:transposase